MPDTLQFRPSAEAKLRPSAEARLVPGIRVHVTETEQSSTEYIYKLEKGPLSWAII